MCFKALLRKTYSLTYYGVKARREVCRGLYVDILRGLGIGARKTGCIMQKGVNNMFKKKYMEMELASTDLEVMREFVDIWRKDDGIMRGMLYKEVDEYYIERTHILVQGVTYGVFRVGGTYYTIFGRLLGELWFKMLKTILNKLFLRKEARIKEETA